MLFVPLPFVVALLLVILLLQMKTRTEQSLLGNLFSWLIVIHAVSSVLVGIRWGYGVKTFLPLQSLLALVWAALSWIGFRGLTQDGPSVTRKDWPHVIPPVTLIVMSLLWPEPIDVLLIASYLGYGLILLRLSASGPNRLKHVKLEDAAVVFRAMQITAWALLVFAIIDVLISVDIRFLGGQFAVHVITVANLTLILLLGYMASIAARGRPDQVTNEPAAADNRQETWDEQPVFDLINHLMTEDRLYQDADLNLAKLARKAGVPARKVSAAINRLTGKNVSQYVNEFRIKEACKLLNDTELSVTELMYAAGFQTKSNFNREFLRVTGMNPRQWREQ